MPFHAVIPEEELWTGEMRGLVVGGKRVLLLRTEQGVFAYEDRCAHLGVPLSQGTLKGSVLTCAAHHYQYDATNGKGINPRGACLTPFAVRIDGGRIAIDPSAPPPAEGT